MGEVHAAPALAAANETKGLSCFFIQFTHLYFPLPLHLLFLHNNHHRTLVQATIVSTVLVVTYLMDG